MPDIIHVDMDCFFAAVEVKDNPSFAGKPVIVGALPGTRGVVSACSYEARKFGVHSAMPISRAYRLCPHGVFIEPHGARYMEESTVIQTVFRGYTPLVEPISVDEAFLDVAGSHRIFGSSETIGHAIKDRIRKETGLVASVGIAPTKFVAKIASDFDKPDGFTVVNDNSVIEFLHPLDVGKMWGVGAATRAELEKLGIRTIGDLAAYPVRELDRRFGKHGRHLHNLSRGIDPRGVEPEYSRKQIGAEYTFNEDTADMGEVETTFLYLADKVASRLHAKGRRGTKITLKLRDETFRTVTRSRSLADPLSASEDIYRTALAMFRDEPLGGRKVRLVGISISGFEESAQTSLFDGGNVRKNTLEDVVADIRNRFGKTSITRARLIGRKSSRFGRTGAASADKSSDADGESDG